MSSVAVIGGGLAGLAAAVALGDAGFEVDLYEARGFLGGRATSWPATGSSPGDDAELVDNCQHILLRCCGNLLDLYGRLGVADRIHFYKEFCFIEPGGRKSYLRRGFLPAPNHFAFSFLGLTFLSWRDKFAIARAIQAIPKERFRKDLDSISMADWLREKHQTPQGIERYWRQILVSAVNEELDRMAASHGLQVFWLGMISRADAYEMGVPSVPLRDLYSGAALGNRVRIHERSGVTAIRSEQGRITGIDAGGVPVQADYYISALPFERLQPLLPDLPVEWAAFEHSPITGIHLWFDRPITDLPNATLLDRTIQWLYNKSEGRHVHLVVSASRSLTHMPRQEVIDLVVKELVEFFPAVASAHLERAHVVKEIRATFSALPGLELKRPVATTGIRNFFLAGDWTRSGWPATMEGAVRSGYLAAEAVARAAGEAHPFLIPDIA